MSPIIPKIFPVIVRHIVHNEVVCIWTNQHWNNNWIWMGTLHIVLYNWVYRIVQKFSSGNFCMFPAITEALKI